MKNLLIYVFSFNVLFFAFSSNAQANLFRKNTATIMFGGVIGAGAGLGSLIFYSNPQSHTENITTGLFLGLIGGAIYVVTQKDSNQSLESFLNIQQQPQYLKTEIAFQDQTIQKTHKDIRFPITQLRLEF